MFAVFRSLRLSLSAAGDTGGGSSSSSRVGCREPSIVSSVVQLNVRRERVTGLSVDIYIHTVSNHAFAGRHKLSSSPGNAAAPGHFGGLVLELGIGMARGWHIRWRGRRHAVI